MTVCMGSTVDRAEEIELQLLLPATQFAALEEAAARSGLNVSELLRSAIGHFLRSPAARSVNDVNAHSFGSTYFAEGLQ